MNAKSYDIIIAGAGLSGLSLAWNLAISGYTGEVLLIDKSFAPLNNKTWCFWTKNRPYFQDIIYKKWRKTMFSSIDYKGFHYMNNHSYYCIRENEFKEFILTELKKFSNFELLEEAILDITSNSKKGALVTKESKTYVADHIFQSIIKPESSKKRNLKYPLIQHFYGIEIKTKAGAFDPETFTIMDVDEYYDDGFAFMYVLPYSDDLALVEYTIFSDTPLKKKFYKAKIKEYLHNKFGFDREDYTIIRREFGKIPMDDRVYEPNLHPNVYNIGLVGGFSKPSTGYTFLRTQKFSEKIVSKIINNQKLEFTDPSKAKYRYYDKLLLHVLCNSTTDSRRIFMHLFKKNKIDHIFNFLNEETSILEDVKIMSSVPYLPFLKALAKNIV